MNSCRLVSSVCQKPCCPTLDRVGIKFSKLSLLSKMVFVPLRMVFMATSLITGLAKISKRGFLEAP